MSDCKIYPADTVDATGYVWPTVGENIRNGGFPGKKIKSIDLVFEKEDIVNKPSFVFYNKTDKVIGLQKRVVILALCIKATASQITITGISFNSNNEGLGVIYLNAPNASGVIRVFYYDN